MRLISKQRLTITVTTATLIGAIAGHLLPVTTPAPSQPGTFRYCQSTGCISHTWLWPPAMRRAR